MAGGVNLPKGKYTISQVSKMIGIPVTSLKRLDRMMTGSELNIRAKRESHGKYEYRIYTKREIEKIQDFRKNELEMEFHRLVNLIVKKHQSYYGWGAEKSALQKSKDAKPYIKKIVGDKKLNFEVYAEFE